MIGSAGTLVDKKGAYVIPKVETTSTTKIYKMKLPQGSVILANNVTIVSGADNLTYNNISYTVQSEYADITFSVPINESVTVYNGKSISYVDTATTQIKLSTPTSIGSRGSFLIYNDEMNLLYSTFHTRWTGTTWASVSTPVQTLAVVYNDELHAFGKDAHYKFDGSKWNQVSTIPYTLSGVCAVVYKNAIHILGGTTTSTFHYKWDGTSWSKASTIPIEFKSGHACVYNDAIHILGGDSSFTAHYKWDGDSWSEVSTIPVNFTAGNCCVYNDCIYILGGSRSLRNCMYFNGTSWNSGPNLTTDVRQGACCVYRDEIHLMYNSVHIKYSTKLDSWTNMEDLRTYSVLKNMNIDGIVATSFGKKSFAYNEDPTLITF